MKTDAHRNQPSKGGAALIIALGFLAVLTIMIIAFSAQMRMDRLSGRGYLVSAQTRQLLDVALTRAMEDIDAAMEGANYPAFLALGSQGGEDSAFLADSIDFATEEEFIPGPGSPIYTNYLQVLDREAQWQAVPDGGEPIGRVGYIVLNTSGLLDANQVGGYTNTTPVAFNNRGLGLSPAELQLDPDLLDELSSGNAPLMRSDGQSTATTNAATAFVYNRTNAWRHFETVRDIKLLNQRGSPNVINRQPESFSTFSLFPNDNTERIHLDTNLDRTSFVGGLLASGLDAKQTAAVYEGYLDYVDADRIPTNLLGSCVEKVPMVNEIWIDDFRFSQEVTDATNVAFRISGNLYVETWYPFEGPLPAQSGLLVHSADPALNDALFADEIVEGKDCIDLAGYITLTATYSNSVSKSFILQLADQGDVQNTDGFRTCRYAFAFDDNVDLEQPFETDDEAPPLQLFAQANDIEVVGSGIAVDRVENVMFQWDFDGNGAEHSDQASCIDPRVNYDFLDPMQWIAGAPVSSNAVNIITDWGEESDLADKSKIRFHVRNGPMQNAAELGFLSIGEPWRTVRLYSGEEGATLHSVLDRFDAGEPLWDAPFRPGSININSRNKAVLATAFHRAPIERYPGEGTALRVGKELAKVLGANLASVPEGTAQNRLSIVGRAVSDNIPEWNNLSDAQKESIVANSYRLFGWRDNLFTILLVAQKTTDADNDGTLSEDEVQSTRQAIAYVWRDPLASKSTCVFYGLVDTLQSSVGSGQTWGAILKDFEP